MTDPRDPADRPLRDACPGLTAGDLVAWLDRELPEAAAARAASHVAACAVCAREADLLRRSADLLGRLPGRRAPEGFAARVVDAVRGRAASPARGGRLLRLPFAGRLAAAAVLVAAAAGTWIALRGDAAGDALTAGDEREIAADLLVLAHLDTLRAASGEDLSRLADDLDVLDAAGETILVEDGG